MTDSEQDDSNRKSGYSGDEINLKELFFILWARKWLIIGIPFTVSILAVIISLMMQNVYRAEALLAPNNNDGAGGLSALTAQYGGLASLAGISLGGGASDNTALGLEILKSRKFISDFIERHDILVPLMAADAWDRDTGQLQIDSDSYDESSGKWVRKVRPPKKSVPSRQEAYEVFIERALSVTQDNKTGFVTIAVEHYSPNIAKQWVDWLIHDINAAVMQQEVDEAEHAIDYLNKQISLTSISGLQNVFFKLIEEQTKTVMLAKVSDEYLLKTLDPAVVAERKVRPKRTVIVLASAFLSGVMAILLVFAMNSERRPRKTPNDA